MKTESSLKFRLALVYKKYYNIPFDVAYSSARSFADNPQNNEWICEREIKDLNRMNQYFNKD